MNNRDKKNLFITVLFLLLSGVSLLLLDNFFFIETPYGHRENPLIDEVKLIHYLFGYSLIFCLGVIYKSHIRVKVLSVNKNRRKSGLTLIISVLMLVISGIGLFYIVDETLSEVVEYIHIIIGFTFSFFFFIHLYKRS